MTPMNGASVPNRRRMDRLTCDSCGRSASVATVKREGWVPVKAGSRIVGTLCGKCQS